MTPDLAKMIEDGLLRPACALKPEAMQGQRDADESLPAGESEALAREYVGIAASHVGQMIDDDWGLTDSKIAAPILPAQAELQAELKRVEAQRDAGNREIERLRGLLYGNGKEPDPEDVEGMLRWLPYDEALRNVAKLGGFADYPLLAQVGEVTITTNEKGECVAVTRQDEEGRILSLLWEKQGEQVPDKAVMRCRKCGDECTVRFSYDSLSLQVDLQEREPQEGRESPEDLTEPPSANVRGRPIPPECPATLHNAREGQIPALPADKPIAPALSPSHAPEVAQSPLLEGKDADIAAPLASNPAPLTPNSSALPQKARIGTDAAVPSHPLPQISTQIRGENSVSGSDTDALQVALQRIQALEAEQERLLRRIDELGGKPPQRDRAAYMRDYRKRTKGVLSGRNPEGIARFLG